MTKCLFGCLIVLLLGFGCSCESANLYEENYSVISNEGFIPSKEEPKLIELIDTKQLKELSRNDDYVLIGQSEFRDSYISRTFAIDCAKKHGAVLVAVGLGEGETIEYDSVAFMPTSSTTYHSGSIYNNSSIGNNYSYYGTSTTYGSTPITVKNHKTYYYQVGYFFAKRKNKSSFGVYFKLPEDIPGNKDTAVRILSVTKGSQAEKLGIKKNDIVKSINGKAITSPDDIMQYTNGNEVIKTIKVSHD